MRSLAERECGRILSSASVSITQTWPGRLPSYPRRTEMIPGWAIRYKDMLRVKMQGPGCYNRKTRLMNSLQTKWNIMGMRHPIPCVHDLKRTFVFLFHGGT